MNRQATKILITDFAERMDQLEPEMAFEYLSIANEMKKKGKDIVSFGIGQPDFSTPQQSVMPL